MRVVLHERDAIRWVRAVNHPVVNSVPLIVTSLGDVDLLDSGSVAEAVVALCSVGGVS